MPRKKIFLSHSVHKHEDKLIMDELSKLLEKSGFDVYSDRQMCPGDCWRNKIYSGISRCHAAIILVTEEALNIEKYPWVFKECSMFTLLKWADKQFPIIPITMTNVAIKDIEESPFKALLFNEIMEASHENLRSVISEIERILGESGYLSQFDPLYHHHTRIGQRFFSKEEELLRKAIERMDANCGRYNPMYGDIGIEFAKILLSKSAIDLIKAVSGDLWGILENIGLDKSLKLIDHLAPFWLDFAAIARMEHIIQEDQEIILRNLEHPSQDENYLRKAFGLNVRKELVARLYIHHAGFLKQKPYDFIIPPNDSSLNDVKRFEAHIMASINSRNRHRSNQPLDEDFLKMIAERPTFIVLPYDTGKEVIQELRIKFKTFVFIVLTGEEDITKWNLPNFVMLEPSLKEETEKSICSLYSRAVWDVNSIFSNEIKPIKT